MSLAGKFIVITGASSGIGLELAKDLSKQGASLILATRNATKTAQVLKSNGLMDSSAVKHKILDLASFASVREFSKSIQTEKKKVDVLFNNAGIMLKNRQVSVDGHELGLQVNYLAPVLLTHLLKPKRNVFLNTGSHRTVETLLDNWEFNENYDGWKSYCHAKRLQLLYSQYCARGNVEGVSGEVLNVCVDPGWIKTDLVRAENGFAAADIQKMMGGASSDFKGALKTLVFAATSDQVKDGDFVMKEKVVKPGKGIDNEADQQALWEMTSDALEL